MRRGFSVGMTPRRRAFWIKLLLAALLALVAAVVVWKLPAAARGGGGGHGGGGSGGGGFSGGGFRGGGYGGSFGGYGSGGGFGGGFFPFPLFFLGGVGGGLFWLLLLFVLLAVVRNLATKTGVGHPIPISPYPASEVPSPPAQDVPAELEALRTSDPAFNERQFRDRAQAAFFLLQKAWMERDLSMARGVMSDSIYQRWKVQIDQMLAAHKKNLLDNLFVAGAEIVKVERDPRLETITVRIDASAADYEVDDRSGQIVFGSRQDQAFTEYWTFVRSAGTKTLAQGGVTERKCPNCGAPLTINESGVCRYCNVIVTSGTFDWVLDNITQANEWRG